MAAAHPEDPAPPLRPALEFERAATGSPPPPSCAPTSAWRTTRGNAFGRLGHALRQLGRHDEAREAYRQGIAAAERHGHPTMAMEFEEVLEEMG
jgi:E3 SUMO-protein ligase RanBP2